MNEVRKQVLRLFCNMRLADQNGNQSKENRGGLIRYGED